MDDEFQFDVFISRAGCDAEVAVRIAGILRANGLRVYMQDSDFDDGHDFVERMEVGIDECRRTLSLVSPAYFESKFTMGEMRAAYALDPSGRSRRLVIAKISECTAPGLYAPRVYSELHGLDDGEFERRVVALAEELSPTAPTPDEAPTAEPAIWNVRSPSPNYTVRVELQEQLVERLAKAGSAAVTQAIKGMGGVGKTQLALWYCHEFAVQYDLVWWVPSETEAEAKFAELAPKLGLNFEQGTDVRLVVPAVKEALEHRAKPWLLVFDNVETPEAIEHLRPSRGGHVLITSRYDHWPVPESLSVGTWSPGESLAFLAKALGREDPLADTLRDALGDYPLALAQAAGYVNSTGTTLADYLQLFRDEWEQLAKDEAELTGEKRTVRTTWELSRQKIGDVGVGLLRLCSFLAPEGITRSLLAADPDALTKTLANAVSESAKFNRAIARLREYSLVTMEDGVLSLHRLLQAVVRDGIRKQDRQDWVERAARAVHAAVPYDQNVPETWVPSAEMVTHAMAVDGHAKTVRLEGNPVGRALDRSGQALHDLGQYSLAREVLLRAVEIAGSDLGDEHGDVATSCSNLALVEQDLGNLGEAKRLMERAVEIWEQAFEADHPTLATSYSNLALVEKGLGNLGEAKRLLVRAVEIGEQAFEADHPTLATSYSNLALVEKGLGNLGEAKRLLVRAVEIGESSFGADHPTLATRYSNLAMVEQDLGSLGEAKRLMERAIAIEQRVFEADHPWLAVRYSNLALVEKDLGNLGEAKRLMERAVEIQEQVFAADHPTLAVSYSNLALVEQDLGNLGEAKRLLVRAVEIGEQAFEADHPNLAYSYNNLADVLWRLGEHEAARLHWRAAYRIFSTRLGVEHPNTKIVAEWLRMHDPDFEG